MHSKCSMGITYCTTAQYTYTMNGKWHNRWIQKYENIPSWFIQIDGLHVLFIEVKHVSHASRYCCFPPSFHIFQTVNVNRDINSVYINNTYARPFRSHMYCLFRSKIVFVVLVGCWSLCHRASVTSTILPTSVTAPYHWILLFLFLFFGFLLLFVVRSAHRNFILVSVVILHGSRLDNNLLFVAILQRCIHPVSQFIVCCNALCLPLVPQANIAV